MSQNHARNGSAAPKVADPFKILVVPYTATPAEVTAAFRRAALATHPDTNPGSDGAAFRAARAAYDSLRTVGQIEAARRRWATPTFSSVEEGVEWLRQAGFQPEEAPLAAVWAHLWVDRETYPECRVCLDRGSKVLDSGNPPAGWRPGKLPPPFSRKVVGLWFRGIAGERPYAVWQHPVGVSPEYVFGPDTL